MTTLLAAYNSEGCIGRCDARCHEATHPNCHCICGGRNHGVGHKKAIFNTCQNAKVMIDEWVQDHPDTTKINVQLSLF